MKRSMLLYFGLVFIIGVISGIGISFFQYQNPQHTKTLYIAPYFNKTHDCYHHDPGCQAELINSNFTYSIFDGKGNLYQSMQTTTGSNGFFSVMLQPNRGYQIKITTQINGTQYRGYTQLSTYEDSPDCITNVHLERVE